MITLTYTKVYMTGELTGTTKRSKIRDKDPLVIERMQRYLSKGTKDEPLVDVLSNALWYPINVNVEYIQPAPN